MGERYTACFFAQELVVVRSQEVIVIIKIMCVCHMYYNRRCTVWPIQVHFGEAACLCVCSLCRYVRVCVLATLMYYLNLTAQINNSVCVIYMAVCYKTMKIDLNGSNSPLMSVKSKHTLEHTKNTFVLLSPAHLIALKSKHAGFTRCLLLTVRLAVYQVYKF